ncbi:sensor histidine kinase [Shewanella psychropiezotolerans]|uniref:histidine kinase n=1 Tax=Shewanella psychropiezotolerans TaxID=2593655 RepID=A0ABX5WUW2_9GAMM|nr:MULTISPECIES: sensor histidine kinase [Shewanella]MPY23255.1 sensor histidine kinase [Shewanella sp. YLB-07]QDO82874.1 sensor histidine kinase [Shewanella psychropiezotolerans]
MISIVSTFKNLGLHNRLAFFSLSLIVIQTFGLGLVATYSLQTNLEEQIGKRALALSKSLVHHPIIIQGLINKDSASVQAFAEIIRHNTEARFIVVGDIDGIRYSHPNVSKLGKKMVGGDNTQALIYGESYISKAKGSLGISVRGKSPIYSPQGDIIGLVSVGFLEEDIDKVVDKFKRNLNFFFGLILLAGVGVTIYISKRYRDDIFGLEPEEIARTYTERKAVLASILEAIIVINEAGVITSVNPVALKLIGDVDKDKIVGSAIDDLLSLSPMLSADNAEVSWRDIEVDINGQLMILTKTPLLINGENKGAVLSFRLKDDIVVLSRKLSQVQQFSTMLQVQTHEYSNKLNTIGGLIQIGSVDEALELITSESSGYQEMIEFLITTIKDPVMAGFFLGKYNQARECNIEFIIESDSSLNDIPVHIPREKLVTILGNIIDNAFDASLKNSAKIHMVNLHMTDIGNDLIFEVVDSGGGIGSDLKANIFALGETTKAEMGHGIGMYLVKNALAQLGGSISISNAKGGGTIMTVYIPKQLGKRS